MESPRDRSPPHRPIRPFVPRGLTEIVMHHSSLRLVTSALVGLLLVGCGPTGPALNPVTGKVTIKGAPASGLQVSFMPVDSKKMAASGKVEGGSYTLYSNAGAGAMAGKYKVVIAQAAAGSGGAPTPEQMAAQYSGNRQGGAPAQDKPSFPAEYSAADTTPLEVEVKAGANTIDIPL